MLNYEVDPRLLDKYVPSGTVLDSFLGKTYVSLVGFRFCALNSLGPSPSRFILISMR
ncbi:MAG: hypothetical protein JWN63_1201 [Candidatus Acidoferrum typicum]|jgi:uncharacterized protein|nr:hypothetical protein [Candidatus Acidoferrum typicum]